MACYPAIHRGHGTEKSEIAIKRQLPPVGRKMQRNIIVKLFTLGFHILISILFTCTEKPSIPKDADNFLLIDCRNLTSGLKVRNVAPEA